MRSDLSRQLEDVPSLDIMSMDSEDLCELLLYVNSDLNVNENMIIIEAIIFFTERTKRFSRVSKEKYTKGKLYEKHIHKRIHSLEDSAYGCRCHGRI